MKKDRLNELLIVASRGLPDGYEILLKISSEEADISMYDEVGGFVAVCTDDMTTEEMIIANVNEARELSGLPPIEFSPQEQ